MEFIYDLLVVLHLLGMAALVGGYLVAAPSGRPNIVMVWGARMQVLTGLLVVGMGEAVIEADYNNAKIGAKLVIALVVVALTEIANGKARKGQDTTALVHGAGALGIVNVLIAALWN